MMIGMTPYGLHGSIRAAPGQGDALAALLLEAATQEEANPGCQLYLVSRSLDDPDLIWVTEVWADKSEHGASLQKPATTELIGRARPIIAGMGDSMEFAPIGGAGIAL